MAGLIARITQLPPQKARLELRVGGMNAELNSFEVNLPIRIPFKQKVYGT